MILVTALPGFNVASDKSDLYFNIRYKNDYYWTYLEENHEIKNLTSEFKKLYFEMLSYSEDERPEIEKILNGNWMKEINDLNESQIKDLENEVREEFKRREEIIKKQKNSTVEIEEEKSSSELGTIRSMEDNNNNFDYNSKPYDIKKGNHFDNFIIIKTNLHPVTLMNKLMKKLSDNYGNKCDIVRNKEKLKFYISFEKEKIEQEEITEKMKEELQKLDINNDEENKNDEKNEEEEEEEEENYDNKIKEEKNKIKVKLFKNKDDEYLLSFFKKEGGLEEFYNNIKKITEQVKKI